MEMSEYLIKFLGVKSKFDNATIEPAFVYDISQAVTEGDAENDSTIF